MRRVVTATIAFGIVALCASFHLLFTAVCWAADASTAKAEASTTPADRVVVMYFHRTQRCPTCLRMGSYSEEAVVNGFAKEIKAARSSSTILTSRTRTMRY